MKLQTKERIKYTAIVLLLYALPILILGGLTGGWLVQIAPHAPILSRVVGAFCSALVGAYIVLVVDRFTGWIYSFDVAWTAHPNYFKRFERLGK